MQIDSVASSASLVTDGASTMPAAKPGKADFGPATKVSLSAEATVGAMPGRAATVGGSYAAKAYAAAAAE